METSGSQVNNAEKYDRQLRLWGDHGQRCLESAHVCLVNASAVGTEILKSLVLPGIGKFTIVDENKVTGQDVGCNFFLDVESIGTPRGAAATRLLQEMNNDVSGNYVDQTVDALISTPDFFSQFSCVIATHLPQRTLLQLADVLWKVHVPLLVARCFGFIGYLRLQVEEHTAIETHPDNTFDDLRLDRPFPALLDFVNSLDLSTMDKKAHSHTPYIVLLLKCLQQWKAQHGTVMPTNYREKKEFKEMLQAGILVNEHGVMETEENFDEALERANASLVPTKVSSDLSAILSDHSALKLTADSPPFWFLTRAVGEFVANEGEGALPVRGVIPDMTADTKRYIELQNIYRAKAAEDVAVVKSHVQRLLESAGKDAHSLDDQVAYFCKNAAFLRLVRCRQLTQEYSSSTMNKENLETSLAASPDAIFYVLLRAADRFQTEHGHYPGERDDEVEQDAQLLKTCAASLLNEWGMSADVVGEDYLREMCRYGASELASVAGFLGGAAAHEVIKIITHQYVPFQNTFIYSGASSTCCTLDL